MNSNEHPKVAGFVRAISVGLALLAGSGCGEQQNAKVEAGRYPALGEVMATELNELAGGKGKVVLVIAESDRNQSTAFGQASDAFQQALDKSFQTGIETVVTPAVQLSGSEPLSADKFAALLQKHADADYLVSFVGVPVLTPAQMAQLPSPRPQVVEVVACNPPTKAMFANKLICLAALCKPADQGMNATGGFSREIFDVCYRLVTPETAASLPR